MALDELCRRLINAADFKFNNQKLNSRDVARGPGLFTGRANREPRVMTCPFYFKIDDLAVGALAAAFAKLAMFTLRADEANELDVD